MPLSDTPLEQGCLTVAAGSHRDGVRDFRVTNGSGGLEVVDPLEDRWRASSFAAGDVLMFHSLDGAQGAAEPDRTGSASRWTRATSGSASRSPS